MLVPPNLPAFIEDDLFLFTRGELDSVKLIMDALDGFKMVSGFVPSLPKSTVFFCGVSNHVKASILNIMPFHEEELPVKYLGVPIISSRILNKDCKILVEKNIASNRDYLWVRWIHMYKLRGRNIWEVHHRGDMSWGWCKILQLHEYVKPFFWTEVGNSLKTSLWYDRWCSLGPLIRLLSPRDIYREGIANPNLTDRQDCLQWCDANGTKSRFSVKCAWEALRPRGVEVSWYNIVWFAHSIPRHSFNLWLIMRRSLKTQDNLRAWDVGPNVDLSMLRCPLCDTQRDSHEHLFFECAYSTKVWDYVQVLVDLDNVPPTLMDIVATLQAMGKARTARSIFGRLILAATTYFIWNERNNRMFNKINRKPEDIRDMIMVTVRLKILTFKFKNTSNVKRLLQRWKMPNPFRLYGN
ncbi:putative reverse transcriptase domain-containing protein [Tanacetum coccineum]